jgi:hypothetical protein
MILTLDLNRSVTVAQTIEELLIGNLSSIGLGCIFTRIFCRVHAKSSVLLLGQGKKVTATDFNHSIQSLKLNPNTAAVSTAS